MSLLQSGFVQEIRSLHVYGKQDLIKSPQQSEELANLMGGETVGYDRGHAPPCHQMLSDIGAWMVKCSNSNDRPDFVRSEQQPQFDSVSGR
jgi:hypothetical protein